MDSDFMNNLANMMKNGNIPDSVKEKMNRIYEPKFTDKILIIWIKQKMSLILHLSKIGTSSNNSINPEMLQNLMKMFSNSSNNSSNASESEGNGSNPSIDINTILKMKSIMDKMGNSKNDPRANLLLSLKPYLKESRKAKVEQYVRFIKYD